MLSLLEITALWGIIMDHLSDGTQGMLKEVSEYENYLSDRHLGDYVTANIFFNSSARYVWCCRFDKITFIFKTIFGIKSEFECLITEKLWCEKIYVVM